MLVFLWDFCHVILDLCLDQGFNLNMRYIILFFDVLLHKSLISSVLFQKKKNHEVLGLVLFEHADCLFIGS